MIEDSVLHEVREARQTYAREHGFDLKAIFADLRERDARGDWKVVRLAPRRPIVPGDSGSRARDDRKNAKLS